ncbi:hypothetical protein NQ315_005201, partial [Exocentrus adspersus]
MTVEDDDACCEHEDINCECRCRCTCRKQSRRFTSPMCTRCLARERKKYVQRVIKGVTVLRNGEVVPIIESTILFKTCSCLDNYKNTIVAIQAKNNLKCQKVDYVIGGVVMSSKGPVYIISTALKRIKKKDKAKQEVYVKQEIESGMENQFQKSFKEKLSENNESCKEVSRNRECDCKPSKETNTEEQGRSCGGAIEETDNESSSPCDCDECECKEKSKIYTGPRCKKCQEKERQKYLERIVIGLKETDSHRMVPVIEVTRLLPSCDCLQNYAERILSMEARKKIESCKAQFVVGGVAMTNQGPVYMLSTALLTEKEQSCVPRKQKNKCQQTKSAPVEENGEENLKYSGCKCKQELDKFLEHKCTCEKCNETLREEPTYIMGGSTATETGTIPLIQGIYEQRCDCLERYMEKIDRLEKYRKRIEARYNLKSHSLKYTIGGVVNGPDGPVYVITGMRPPVDCECARALRRKQEEELHLQEMAKMPPTGRIKYQISGVRHTPEGNVFIISQALPIDDCSCMKLFDTYAEAHKACLDAYENFLLQTNEELEQYMAEESKRGQLEEATDGDGGEENTEEFEYDVQEEMLEEEEEKGSE